MKVHSWGHLQTGPGCAPWLAFASGLYENYENIFLWLFGLLEQVLETGYFLQYFSFGNLFEVPLEAFKPVLFEGHGGLSADYWS